MRLDVKRMLDPEPCRNFPAPETNRGDFAGGFTEEQRFALRRGLPMVDVEIAWTSFGSGRPRSRIVQLLGMRRTEDFWHAPSDAALVPVPRARDKDVVHDLGGMRTSAHFWFFSR